MKWKKFEAIRKQHPWIKQFVGTLEMHTNRGNDIWGKRQEMESFRDWVRNNLDCIIFLSTESLKEILKDYECVTHGEEINENKNIYYPHWSYRVRYILYHQNGSKDFKKPFSAKYCPFYNEVLADKINWLKREFPADDPIIIDAILIITWSARTVSGKMQQRLNIWLLPENFTV
jgi:hypothetical protein